MTVARLSSQKRGKKGKKRRRRRTSSPQRSNYFIKKSTEAVKEEPLEDRLAKVPLDQDEAFLKAIKAELIGLMNRVRSETK